MAWLNDTIPSLNLVKVLLEGTRVEAMLRYCNFPIALTSIDYAELVSKTGVVILLLLRLLIF